MNHDKAMWSNPTLFNLSKEISRKEKHNQLRKASMDQSIDSQATNGAIYLDSLTLMIS